MVKRVGMKLRKMSRMGMEELKDKAVENVVPESSPVVPAVVEGEEGAHAEKKHFSLTDIVRNLWHNTRNFMKGRFDLKEDSAPQVEVVEGVRKGIDFKGTNLWVLMFAVFIASLECQLHGCNHRCYVGVASYGSNYGYWFVVGYQRL